MAVEQRAGRLPRGRVGRVTDAQEPGWARGLLDQREVGGADLAGLVDDELVGRADLDGMTEPVRVAAFAEELGDVAGLGQAFGGHDAGGVLAERQADQPAAGEGVPNLGGRGDGPGLACPGGGGQQGHGPVGDEQADDGPWCCSGSRSWWCRSSSARTCCPVTRGLIGRRADLHDVGADGAGDGEHGHVGDVGRGGADGQDPVDFQAQVRDPPRASLSLRFGDGDPCGPGLVRGGQLQGRAERPA